MAENYQNFEIVEETCGENSRKDSEEKYSNLKIWAKDQIGRDLVQGLGQQMRGKPIYSNFVIFHENANKCSGGSDVEHKEKSRPTKGSWKRRAHLQGNSADLFIAQVHKRSDDRVDSNGGEERLGKKCRRNEVQHITKNSIQMVAA